MTLDEKLDALTAEIQSLKEMVREVVGTGVLKGRAHPERADDLVDARYVSERLGVSLSAVLHGKAGTGNLARIRQGRLVRFRRGDVERFLREKAEATTTPTDRALRLLNRRKRA